MTLEEFDLCEQVISQTDRDAEVLRKRAIQMEANLYVKTGIKCDSRDPGFPCWTAMGIGYYNTPREAFIAKLKNEQIGKDLR